MNRCVVALCLFVCVLLGTQAAAQTERALLIGINTYQPEGTSAQQGVAAILATIIQSRSTNTRAYKVVIHNDGSATAEISGASFGLRIEPPRSQQFPPERSIQKRCAACLQGLAMSAESRPESAQNRFPSERALRLSMRARPVEICNVSGSKPRAAIRRYCKHLKTWADSCGQP
jgi:hypothetical protein